MRIRKAWLPNRKKIRALTPEEGTQDKHSKQIPMATRQLAHLRTIHLNSCPALPLLSYLWRETATQCHHCPTSWTQAQMEVAFCKLPLATV